ncbi:MAG TPA: tRNA pseudouridine(38-40) synthase TruA [Terriglobia bacterium]|nr:tRNA pseudouridine(38-40) synthase TruA [Terriglobia bacterium]
MRNIRLLIAYDGTDFHGWQRQPNVPTIQACLESMLEKLIEERVTLYGSGRTDAGVHALNQVANFKMPGNIPPANLLKAMNNLLPSTIRVKKVEEVEESFHARYDARAKTYRYRISLAPIASPFTVRYVHHYPYPLDLKVIATAARYLEGEHDFTSFAGSDGSVHEPPTRPLDVQSTNLRTIFASRILWRPRISTLIYEVRGSGFLHHMVRNIVGTLLEVGRGKLEPQEVLKILKARDRTRAGPTAPASGLCLMKVEYGAGRSLGPAHID